MPNHSSAPNCVVPTSSVSGSGLAPWLKMQSRAISHAIATTEAAQMKKPRNTGNTCRAPCWKRKKKRENKEKRENKGEKRENKIKTKKQKSPPNMMEQREKRNKKEGTMVRKLTADGVDANFPLASIRVVDINPPTTMRESPIK